jgi:hypothetical protein
MSFWSIIVAAWHGAFGAMRRNPTIVLMVFCALFILTASFDYFVPPMHNAITNGPLSHHVARSTPRRAILGLIQDILTAIIVVPLMVSVHRFILLGEHGHTLSNKQRLLSFGLCLVLINMMSGLPGEIEGVLRPQSMPQVMLLVAIVMIWIVTVRLLLTYPAAALDKSAPLLDSWERTRGHWWYIAGVVTCGWLPFIAIFIILLLMFFPGFKIPSIFSGGWIALLLFSTLLRVLFIAVGAGLVSELYRKFDGLAEQSIKLPYWGNDFSKKPRRIFNPVVTFGISLALILFYRVSQPSVAHAVNIIATSFLILMLILILFLRAKNRSKR